jgi:DNA-binding MarR family transcriptional regulator
MPERNEAAILELAYSLQLLVRRIRAAAPAESNELSWTQNAVLARLAQVGPATTAELARAEGMKSQSMAVAVAALEELGLVERKAHPTDGRQVNIQLTSRGVAMRKRTTQAKEMWLARAVAKLEPKEQDILFAAVGVIKRLGEL